MISTPFNVNLPVGIGGVNVDKSSNLLEIPSLLTWWAVAFWITSIVWEPLAAPFSTPIETISPAPEGTCPGAAEEDGNVCTVPDLWSKTSLENELVDPLNASRLEPSFLVSEFKDWNSVTISEFSLILVSKVTAGDLFAATKASVIESKSIPPELIFLSVTRPSSPTTACVLPNKLVDSVILLFLYKITHI